jgi:hypothetical protein
MDSQVAEHLRETQNLVHEFNRAQELLKDKVSALQLMYVFFCLRFWKRISVHRKCSFDGKFKMFIRALIPFRLEEAEARFRNRPSRDEDTEVIQSLKTALTERDLELKKMLVRTVTE